MFKIGMSPQLVFAIHIGTNLVVTKHNTTNVKKLKDIEKTLGLKPDQVQDLMKYTGKNFDDFAKAVKNGELDSLLGIPEMNMKYLMKQTGKSADEIADWLKRNDVNLKDINAKNVDDIIKGASGAKKSILPKDLSNYEVPTVKNGDFNKWFNELSVEDFNRAWQDTRLRDIIERRIRKPGGLHEWLLVSRAEKFKQWGASMDDIKDYRTSISEIEFKNPYGVHGGQGSTVAHNELLKLVDSSSSFEDYLSKLNIWAEHRLKNGILDLPEGLRR